MQPGYYITLSNLDLIKTSTLNNKLYDRSNAVIGGKHLSTAAKIGYEMELDGNVATATYNNRYYVYTVRFRGLTNYPCMMYASDRDNVMDNSQVFNHVTTWLK